MTLKSHQHDQEHTDLVFLYVLQALPPNEICVAQDQISRCADCREELESLRPVVGTFVCWPTDVLRPSVSLWGRLARRIANETGKEPISPPQQQPLKPEWQEAAPGISVKLLAADRGRDRISMLVKLAPGTDYPPHRHAGIEELHLLHGELMIGHKKLCPGDYIRAESDTVDHRVWSETGCTCVLLTSIKDAIL